MLRRSVTAIVGGSSLALMASLGLTATAANSAPGDILITAASYQYGNWSQPGAGFGAGADDTLSQVYQLTWRGSFPDLDDTPGPVYAAGTFVASGATNINRVGQWDANTSRWVTLPGDDTGIGFGVPKSLAMGASVSAGFGLPGVFGLVLGGDDSLYAGGAFAASDDTLNNVAKWNGTDWVRMGNGLTAGTSGTGSVNEIVQDMVIGNDFIGMDDTDYTDDTVYAIGGFDGTCATLACTGIGRTAAGIAQYSQADDTWYPMGIGTISQTSGYNDLVFAGSYIDDTLYAGGNFTALNSSSFSKIARWSEAAGAWRSVGAGLNGNVFSMAVHPITKDLYVGGTFTAPVGYPASSTVGIAKWDYSDDTWYAVGTGLTGGNTDDISFSPDGKTMYLGSWASAPTVSGTFANGVAILTSDDLDDSTATTVGGNWQYIKSAGAIGVTGPGNPSINQTSTRAVLALPQGTLMAGGNFHTAGTTAVNRVALFTPGPEPDPNAPATPPGPPQNVVATPGWQTVTVDWDPPENQGTYPITNYLVRATPGGSVCITRLSDAKLTQCTFTSLKAGTQYTFTVQGLNGGGWGARSAASNIATPYEVKLTSSSRKRLTFLTINLGSEVRASGTAFGYSPGTRITPYIKFGDTGQWVAQTSSRLVSDERGRFSWKRKFAKKLNTQRIYVQFGVGDDRSNIANLGPVR